MFYKKGFTIIELIVVVAIIAVLSAIVLVNVNGYIAKARNARRAADMDQIYKALLIFYGQYGCLPVTSGSTCAGAGGYVDSNSGGWDYSSQGGFMNFLKTSGAMGKVPVDPINNMTGDGGPSNTYAYRYYCYPGSGLHLGYWTESGWVYVMKNIGGWSSDANFVCQ